MPKEYSRIHRIAELIQHEIAGMILKDIQDPQLQDITVLKVEVTRDLAYAKIFVSVLDEKADIKDKVRRLNKAASFLRYQLANSIDLRVTPQLRFVFDSTLITSNRLSSLLADTPIVKEQDD